MLKLSAINILMCLLCHSLGMGNGCSTWNYKLLVVPGVGAAAAALVVRTLGWLKENLLCVAALDSSSALSLLQVQPVPRVCVVVVQDAQTAERGFGAHEGVCSSEVLSEVTNDDICSFCSIPEVTCKCRTVPRQLMHFTQRSLYVSLAAELLNYGEKDTDARYAFLQGISHMGRRSSQV